MFDFACHRCVKDYLGIMCITNHNMDIVAGHCLDTSSSATSSPPAIRYVSLPFFDGLAAFYEIQGFFWCSALIAVVVFPRSPVSYTVCYTVTSLSKSMAKLSCWVSSVEFVTTWS